MVSEYFYRLSPQGDVIDTTNRIIIENTNSSITLKIKSVQIEDMGTYILQAVNDAKIEHLNFTLEVLGICLSINKLFVSLFFFSLQILKILCF
jgi:hypothetical protein